MTAGNSVTWLFVPASRGNRFDRACGADEVILDLEDSVSPDAKDVARESAVSWLSGDGAGWVSINGAGTAWQEGDLAAVRGCVGPRGVVVPKAEDPDALIALRGLLPAGVGVAEGCRPSATQLDWAARVLEAAAGDGERGTFTVAGQMIDRPVLARAQAILTRSGVPE